MQAVVPVEAFEALTEQHRLELAKREMQLVRYRQTLIENGIEPPDADGEELLRMWQSCRMVITTASAFVMDLGSAKELLDDWGKG